LKSNTFIYIIWFVFINPITNFILIRCWIRCVYNIKHGFKFSNMDYKYCLISVYKHDKHQQLFIGFHWFYVGFFLYYFLLTSTVRILKKNFLPISTFEEVTLEFMPNSFTFVYCSLIIIISTEHRKPNSRHATHFF
jgi:hypothetical protein